MGSRGPLQPTQFVKLNGDVVDIPNPPSTLCDELKEAWIDYWMSQVARATDRTDVQGITRLFWYRQQLHEAMEQWGEMSSLEKVVMGSRNEDATQTHPVFGQITKLEAQIQKLEDKFGLSPLSRARLGIELGTAELTWAEIKRRKAREDTENNSKGLGPSWTEETNAKSALPVGIVVE